MSSQIDLKSLTREKLINWMEKENFSGFRGKQIFNWVYKNGVNQIQNMKNLPSSLIKFLIKNAFLNNLSLVEKKIAEDGTIKYLWELKDGARIESVYLPYKNQKRKSICISTQVGCKMKCKFCATGQEGLSRNLTAGEIVDQVVQVQRDISETEYGTPALTHIVYMGMGEPLDNLENVITSIKILNEKKGFNFGMRKITISTAGLVPEIRYLSDLEWQIGLALSLNAPNDELRSKIMPVNQKYPIKELLESVKYYINKTGRRPTFEYVLIKDRNDSLKLAQELSVLLKNINCHINLIPVNPVPSLNIQRPPLSLIKKFASVLEKNGLNVTIRKEKGVNIKAACGQLRSSRKRRM